MDVPINRAKYLIGRKRQHQRIKDQAFNSYGGYICKCCGETEIKFLTIDHIIPCGNIKETYKIRQHLYEWLKKCNYPEGFQVLCMNCNFAKGKFGVCPHKLTSNPGNLLNYLESR